MDLDNMTALQTNELRTDLQVFQRDLHRVSTEMEVMKSRVSMLWVALLISLILNFISVGLLLFILIKN